MKQERGTPEQIMPFWQWKQEQHAKDQTAGTPRSKEDYYRDYGGYCNKVRRNAFTACGYCENDNECKRLGCWRETYAEMSL